GHGHSGGGREALRGRAEEDESQRRVRDLSGGAARVLLGRSAADLQEGGLRGCLEALRGVFRQASEGLARRFLTRAFGAPRRAGLRGGGCRRPRLPPPLPPHLSSGPPPGPPPPPPGV